MTLLKVGDSSTPPATYPAADGWGYYIGGDTPHVWTPEEVDDIPTRYRLPIFTRSNPAAASAATDAAAIVAHCRSVKQPAGTLVAIDLEAAIARTYVTAADRIITAAGWRLLIYGQLSTVTKNPKPAGGYWVGEWDGDPDDPSWAGKQYEDAGPYDLSEFNTPYLWDTRPAPATPADPAAADQEDEPMFIMDAPTDDTGKTRAMFLLTGSVYVHIPGAPADSVSYPDLAKKAPVIVIDWPFHQNLIKAHGAAAVTD